MTRNSVVNYCHWYTVVPKPKSTYSTSACCLMVVYFLWSAPVRAIDSNNPDLCGNSSSHANIDIVISVFHCVIMPQTIQYRAVYHPLNIVGVGPNQRPTSAGWASISLIFDRPTAKMMLGVGHILNRLFVLITPVLLLIYTTAVCSGFDMITILPAIPEI